MFLLALHDLGLNALAFAVSWHFLLGYFEGKLNYIFELTKVSKIVEKSKKYSQINSW